MELIIGIAIVLILFFSSNIIEKRLKSIENQNKRVIEILEEIRDKNVIKVTGSFCLITLNH